LKRIGFRQVGLDNLKEARYGRHLREMRRCSRFHLWILYFLRRSGGGCVAPTYSAERRAGGGLRGTAAG
jgi:hypothetical protein